MKKVVCVLKRSEIYDYDYVDKLAEGVNRNLSDFEFSVIDWSPWDGWWAKMSMFDPKVTGDFLYFDLDTIIVGDISDLFRNETTVLMDLGMPDRMASGVMYLKENDRAKVWNDWISNPDCHMEKFGRSHGRGQGDGGFLQKFLGASEKFQDAVPGQIVSYKFHVKDRGIPENARVICYHGKPRPRETGWAVT